jgi:Zn-dependent M32 family carboxypeptidase
MSSVEEFEKRLKDVEKKIKPLVEKFNATTKALSELLDAFYKYDVYYEVRAVVSDLEDTVREAIDEIIARELSLDVNVTKYEEQYDVDLMKEEWRIIGIAVLDKPHVVVAEPKTYKLALVPIDEYRDP